MAQVEESNNKPSPNVELNLVPFIDLMCVCITFLLITAVWTQVSMIELGTSVYGKRTSEQNTVPPRQDFVAFRLDVRETGFVINIGLQEVRVPKIGGVYDESGLKRQILRNVRSRYPQKTDAVISISDDLSYELLIQGMDILIGQGFTDIGIASGEVL